MEEASKAKKAKKGFMTPERKKKLRVKLSDLRRNVLSKTCFRLVAVEKESRRRIEERAGTESGRKKAHH